MKFGLIIAGLLFFANPNINIVDILPDFIGYLLISRAIGQVCAASPSLADANDKFRRAALVSLVKLLCIPVAISVSSTEKGMLLIFAMCFAGIETYLAISAFSDFFAGVEYVALRCGANEKIARAKGLRILTYVFLIMRALFSVLPETVYISLAEYIGEYSYSLVAYKPVLTLVNIVFTLVLAVIWYAFSARYFGRLSKDPTLKSGIAELDTVGATPKKESIVRTFSSALSAMFAGAIFSADFFADGYNLLPDLASVLCMTYASYMLVKICGKAKVATRICAASSVICTIYTAYSYVYAAKYYQLSTVSISKVGTHFAILVVLCAASAISFVAAIIAINRTLREAAKEHCISISEGDPELTVKRERKALAAIDGKLFSSGVALAIAKLLSVASVALLTLADKFWIISFAVSLFSIALFKIACDTMLEKICDRYGI